MSIYTSIRDQGDIFESCFTPAGGKALGIGEFFVSIFFILITQTNLSQLSVHKKNTTSQAIYHVSTTRKLEHVVPYCHSKLSFEVSVTR